MLYELQQAGYSQGQAHLAELWIVRGDWVYRGAQARLELSDFFVDRKKVEHLLDADVVIFTHGQLRKRDKAIYEQGERDGIAQGIASAPKDETLEALKVAKLKQWEAEQQRDEAQADLNRLLKQKFNQQQATT